MTALTLATVAALTLTVAATAHGRDENGRRRTFRASMVAAFRAGAAA